MAVGMQGPSVGLERWLRMKKGWVALLVATAVLAGCDKKSDTRPTIVQHVLDRVAYGPDPWTLQRVQELGGAWRIADFVEEQLHPELLDDSALEAEIAALYPSQAMPYGELRGTYHEYTGDPDIGPTTPRSHATRAKVMRAVRSKRQLEQVLVDFWYNHFNVDTMDLARWGFVMTERDAIRPHVFGRFEDMLVAVTKTPGMLDYLDNRVNFKEGFVYNGLRYGINENFGRELLELHTVGVDAGYTQDDVYDAARAFTGWTVPSWPPHPDPGFLYVDEGHDKDTKVVMGLVLPAGRGMEDGLDLLRFLARHPRTAEHIALKLCRRFVSEDPPPALVANATLTFLLTDGDLREVMRTILLSQDFLGLQYARSKVKRPLVFVASLARAVGVADHAAFASAMDGRLQNMGEGLYRSGPPTGYPDASSFWSGEGPFVQRMSVAWDATQGNLGFAPSFEVTGTTPDRDRRSAPTPVLPVRMEPTTRTALVDLATGLPGGQRVRQTAATLLVSPDFLLH
jgi:hypothetical protein